MQGLSERPRRRSEIYAAQGSEAYNDADEFFSTAVTYQ